MIFRCGMCLKEKDEAEPKKFTMISFSPDPLHKPRWFHLCEDCQKNLTPREMPLFDSETIQLPSPTSGRTFFQS